MCCTTKTNDQGERTSLSTAAGYIDAVGEASVRLDAGINVQAPKGRRVLRTKPSHTEADGSSASRGICRMLWNLRLCYCAHNSLPLVHI